MHQKLASVSEVQHEIRKKQKKAEKNSVIVEEEKVALIASPENQNAVRQKLLVKSPASQKARFDQN